MLYFKNKVQKESVHKGKCGGTKSMNDSKHKSPINE